jgi:hypothetical protein
MLLHHPDEAASIAAERAGRLRAAARRSAGGRLRRGLGTVLIAAGRRLHPDADRAPAPLPLEPAGAGAARLDALV